MIKLWFQLIKDSINKFKGKVVLTIFLMALNSLFEGIGLALLLK